MAMDFELSEEHKMIQKTVDDMIKRFAPRREEFRKMVLKEKKFPQELWDALAEAGIMGSLIPAEYGGTGLGLTAMVVASETMGSHGFGTALTILTTMDSLCILRNGSEEMKRRFLPGVAQGKLKFAFALTEPDAGSNTFRLKTVARKNGSAYSLSGQKTFITGVDAADYMLVVARTTTVDELAKQGLPKAFGLSLFMVDCKSKGIELQVIPTHGIEGMRQFTIFFDDVKVPAENLIGQENMGSMALFNTLNPERILAAATAVGMSDYVIGKAVEYASQRKVFRDQPIGVYQGLQHPLAECKIELEGARLLMYKAAWAFDKGFDPAQVGTWANMAKYQAAEVAIKSVDRAIQTHGGYGFSEEYGLIYYWEGTRLLRTAPISKEMILNYISEHVLGMPRSY
ncbi:MAG: acyl-CoA/acyl-ACP dehydrogenase [Nitrospirae bacterium]|nr:acyl-CoA/acyl-ACP dehydrogenase [Nitrospirota bacterium]